MNKKIIACLLVGAMVWSLTGCGGEKTESSGKEIAWPAYSEEKQVFLSAYMSPWKTDDEQYQWVKESGLNHLYINYSSNKASMLGAIEQCERVGVKTIPLTCWGRPVSAEKSYDKYPIDMHDYAGFSGFNILDEPFYEDFDFLAAEYQKYKIDFPDKIFYTNLLRPNVGKNNLSEAKNISYDIYISEFIEKIMKPIQGRKVMSMTLYPLLIDSDTKEKSIQNTHLIDLGKFAVSAKEADALMYHFVQTISFGGTHHAPTEADIRFQIYSGMAFGSKGFQYFTYATPNTNHEFSLNDVGMINRNNQRTSVYYGVQAVNRELYGFDDVFLSFDWKGAMLIDGNLSTAPNEGFGLYRSNGDFPLFESTETLSAAQCSRDTLIGVMEDGQGREGYTVVNYTHPSYGLTDKLSLNFSDARGVLAYVNGKEERITRGDTRFKNGVFTAELQPGEGMFIVPVK